MPWQCIYWTILKVFPVLRVGQPANSIYFSRNFVGQRFAKSCKRMCEDCTEATLKQTCFSSLKDYFKIGTKNIFHLVHFTNMNSSPAEVAYIQIPNVRENVEIENKILQIISLSESKGFLNYP